MNPKSLQDEGTPADERTRVLYKKFTSKCPTGKKTSKMV